MQVTQREPKRVTQPERLDLEAREGLLQPMWREGMGEVLRTLVRGVKNLLTNLLVGQGQVELRGVIVNDRTNHLEVDLGVRRVFQQGPTGADGAE